MKQHLGRKQASNAVVHHINGDKQDNRLENPKVISRSEHNREHSTIQFSNATKVNLGPARPMICIETGELFPSLRSAYTMMGIGWSSIARACRGKVHTAGG